MLKEILIGAAGIGIGYFAADRVLTKRYGRLLDEEIKRTKEFFGANYEGSPETLDNPEFMEAAIDAAESITKYSGGDVKIAPSVLAQEVQKTVTNYNKPGVSKVDAEADAIQELRGVLPLDPDAKAPYLITFEEFDAEELGYEQVTVSFFAGDGIVIDEEDEVITPERVEQTIGTDNLNLFGTNTTDPNMDPNVIYIRCERFNMDFEVTRSAGKHSVEVLGQTG